MAISQPRDVLPQDGGEMTDRHLLECFITRRDEAAFEALVRRHGPMVLGVCRRVLRHPQDAEDAFQATFLVLVRKAASIGHRELLGNWLYGVAYRTALDARAAAIRRQSRERQVSPMPEPEIADDADICRDLLPLLDRELNRLPDKYRIPVVLCDLEGITYRDAAQQLGIPAGTLSGRLTTAHRMLAKRLARHGLALSGGALMAALSPSAASASVASPLVASTVQAATAAAAGQVAAGVGSAQAAALAEGVVKAMLVKKLKIVAAALLAVFVVGAAAVVEQADRKVSDAGAARILDLGEWQRGVNVVWSPDGKTLAVVTRVEKTIFGFIYDRRGSRGSAIRLWDVETGQMKQTLAEDRRIDLAFRQVVFSADGKTIAAIDDELFQEVILPNGREIRVRNTVKIWDAQTFALKQTLGSDSELGCVALSADGKLAATVTRDHSKKTIELRNTRTGALERTLETGEAWPEDMAFSPDSKLLVVGCQKADDSELQLWDAQTWKLKHVLKHDKSVNTVTFSEDGKRIASRSIDSRSGGEFVQLWDAEKGKLIRSLKLIRSHNGVWTGSRCLAFSPDSQTIAAAWWDGQIQLWDVQTGELKETLKGHAIAFSDEIYSLAFSPDGKTLASASQDATVRLWPINKRAAGQK